MSTIQELKDTILKVVLTEGDATFTRLEQLDGFTGGERTLGDNDKNIVVWDRMTDDAVTAVLELQEEGRIQSRTTTLFIYTFDGGGIVNLPIAKKPPANGYKELHWLPILLVPGGKS